MWKLRTFWHLGQSLHQFFIINAIDSLIISDTDFSQKLNSHLRELAFWIFFIPFHEQANVRAIKVFIYLFLYLLWNLLVSSFLRTLPRIFFLLNNVFISIIRCCIDFTVWLTLLFWLRFITYKVSALTTTTIHIQTILVVLFRIFNKWIIF